MFFNVGPNPDVHLVALLPALPVYEHFGSVDLLFLQNYSN